MKCPICKNKLGFADQMKEWDDEYGGDVLLEPDFPCIINVFCDHCDKPVALVVIEAEGIILDEETQAIVKEKVKTYEKRKKRKVN